MTDSPKTADEVAPIDYVLEKSDWVRFVRKAGYSMTGKDEILRSMSREAYRQALDQALTQARREGRRAGVAAAALAAELAFSRMNAKPSEGPRYFALQRASVEVDKAIQALIDSRDT